MYAVLAVAAAAVVGGSAEQTDQPEEPVRQTHSATLDVRSYVQSQSSVPFTEQKKTKCSAPIRGEGVSQQLMRLARSAHQQLSQDEAHELAEAPNGQLYVSAMAQNPKGPETALNVADSICVIRSIDTTGLTVWWVDYPGYDHTASR